MAPTLQGKHRPLTSCLLGLYSCRWRRKHGSLARPGDCCCSKSEGASFGVLAAAFCLTLLFLYFWTQAKNDYNDFDWFNYGNLGFWWAWSLVLLVIAALFFSYVAGLMLLAVCLLSQGQSLSLHWSHKIVVMLSLMFAIAAIAVMSDLWALEWITVRLSFQVTAPYLHVGGVSLMTALAWPVALHFFSMLKIIRRYLILVVYLSILLALYLVPLGMYSPCIRNRGTLGPPPKLFGHRGAPMMAPENTAMAFEKAVEAGCDGLETDVIISYDGVPFLMHDRSLRRTTNVDEVFPNHGDKMSDMYTWPELRRLNAGAWFLSTDPYGTVGSLGAEDRQRAGEQPVCTLLEFLEVAARYDKLVIFDLYRPPREHPYSNLWIQRTLDVIRNESTIKPSQVLWLNPEFRELVQEQEEDFQQTSGTVDSIERLQSQHINRLNLHYTSMSVQLISHYAAANITTNLYVISEAWIYSVAWCTGAHSVTTNAPHILKAMKQPLFLMTPDEYKTMWLVTDVLSLLLVASIFTLHRCRARKPVDPSGLSGLKSTLEGDKYVQLESERSDIWSVSHATTPPAGQKHNLATPAQL
ncbi:glycerophosphodiester phosphodiesterase domain-containing protein 5 [Hippocampus comes]|uniref:glycerophosphodiester phosphodiesterase domain-containing protein 5 n=1 Tax=Hippocampus comes TaxID=109280 RepID=UPI00094EC48B|nr:PREDICTED: glycerophosphodiester phosphodiesterase domain-containing protein 5-like [Hippocampus comes]XP_019725184.1 PREDICTED: glycerophosphodiester phosphodiesterase domain-containing protein 5-like [Hippocampus comes]